MHLNSVQYVQYAHIPVSKMNIVVIYPFRRALKKKKGKLGLTSHLNCKSFLTFALITYYFPVCTSSSFK